MRSFSAFVLLVLCGCTLASWFHREPVRRSIAPIRSTTSADEVLTENAVNLVRECLGTSPYTMSGLAAHLRSLGEPSAEKLDWRLVNFTDENGKKFRLTYRPERAGALPELRHFSLHDNGSKTELPPAESFQAALFGKTLLSDVASTSYRMKGGHRLTVQTDQGRVRGIDYRTGELSLQCSSSFGPAVCACTRSIR